MTAPDDGGNVWTYEWTGLPKYASGTEIKYSITEDAIDGYAPEIKDFDITNSYTPGKTSLTVTKIWEDEDDYDGFRPDSVTVHLFADGLDTGKDAVLSGEDWSYIWTDLDVNEAGVPIKYTVAEDQVAGYDAPVITGDATKGYTITNTHKVEKIDLGGTKVWNDADNQDGIRPESICVQLYADGEYVTEKSISGTADSWPFTFEGLYKYVKDSKQQTVIDYTLQELDAGHKEIEGYTLTTDKDTESGITLTNTHTPATRDIKATKIWVDNGDQDGIRPAYVHVILERKTASDAKWTQVGSGQDVGDESDWTFVWENQPVYKNGEELLYHVTEKPVSGYNVDENGNAKAAVATGNMDDGFVFTNVHTPALVADGIRVRKVITGDAPEKDSTFRFGITRADKSFPMPAGEATISVTGEAEESFDKIIFDKAGEYTYTVAEINDKAAGYQYDASEYTIKYVITKNEEANELTAVRTILKDGVEVEDQNAALDFTNTYTASKPHLTVTMSVTSNPSEGTEYLLNDKITYSIKVANDGNAVINNVVLKDELTGSSWTINKLNPGKSKTETTTAYIVTAKDVTNGKVVNRATATGKSADPRDASVPVTDCEVEVPTGVKNNDSYGLLQAKVLIVSKTTITVEWKAVPGATSYILYGNLCGDKYKTKKMGVVNGTSFKVKKLKKGTYYKFRVEAMKDGEMIAKSKVVHAVTDGGSYGNAIKLTVSKSNVTLAPGGKYTVTTKVTNNKKAKNHRPVVFESDNPNIAKVGSKTGKITGVKPGTCYVYAYAQNGLMKRIKVTVK